MPASSGIPHETVVSARFVQASRYYTSGRPPYPSLLIRRVADLVGLGAGDRVLDLGTGPGFLAIGLAAHVGEVVAIDPSPEMLEVAAANAAAAGVPIRLLPGSSATLGPDLGRFRLVAIGRAFHWMDRADTLRRLDRLVEDGGAVALFSDRTPDVPENAWNSAYGEVRAKYAERDRLGPEVRSSPLPHEAILLASPFDAIERHAVFERRVTPLERFADRVLSFGATWSHRDDGLPEAVAADVTAELGPFATDGAIREVIEGQAIIARRSR